MTSYLFNSNASFYGLNHQFMNNIVIFASRSQFEGQGWLGTLARNYWAFVAYFVFKCLEGYFSGQVQAEVHLYDSHQAVEAPALPRTDHVAVGKCPLCSKSVDIPSIIRTVNHTYCYGCLTSHIDRTGKCPETGLAAESREVTRVYD